MKKEYTSFCISVGCWRKNPDCLSSCSVAIHLIFLKLTFLQGVDQLMMGSCVWFTILVSSGKTSVILHGMAIADRENILVLSVQDKTCKHFWYKITRRISIMQVSERITEIYKRWLNENNSDLSNGHNQPHQKSHSTSRRTINRDI